jgi:hypothetical protein
MKTYKIVNGTSYDERTPDEVIQVLESARLNRTRLHISLGETDNDRGQLGRDWLESFETHGYIGRSMGPIKVSLLVANRRSTGGGAILDHCIVRIRASAGGRELYKHPQYHFGAMEIRRKAEPVTLPDGRVLRVDVLRDGQEQAAFESEASARRYVNRLGVQAPIVA